MGDRFIPPGGAPNTMYAKQRHRTRKLTEYLTTL